MKNNKTSGGFIKKDGRRRLLFLIVCLIFCFACPLLRANTEPVKKMIPAQARNDFSSRQAVLKKSILSQLKKSPFWCAYEATRANNTSLCDSSSSGDACWGLVQDFIFLKKMAQGDCSALPPNRAQYTDICQAVKSSSCSSVAGWKNNFCEAMVQGNRNLLVKAYSAPDFSEYIKNKEGSAEFLLNIYTGFKKNSAAECSKFSGSASLLKRSSCAMLFGKQTSAVNLEDLAQDIATAAIAKEKKKKDYCGKINNQDVKAACLDDNITSLSEILERVWE